MTRKKAIEIVVANVKMGWPSKRWDTALVYYAYANDGATLSFVFWAGAAQNRPGRTQVNSGWQIPRKWLEDKGYL
jgi:hypothetical protein